MLKNKERRLAREQGMSLGGLIITLALLGMVAMVGMKVVPTFIEFMSIKKAIVTAKNTGTTPAEIRSSFDKLANTGYFDAISSKDLVVTKGDGGFEVSFSYQKKIPLVGPASLVMDYEGTTLPSGVPAKPRE
ncbi:MAG: DUF4845 domain-containing protein [Pseudomonadota bacterium]